VEYDQRHRRFKVRPGHVEMPGPSRLTSGLVERYCQADDHDRQPTKRQETFMAETPQTGARADSWPGRIGAITLFVDDVAAAKSFYREVFDLPVMFEDQDSVVFDFGNTVINLLATSAAPELVGPAPVAPREAGVRLQLTIDVPDVDAICAELAGRGVELLNGPMDRPWGIRTASFRDPGGHVWEVAH
jgi:catechol 2,3-dioxygenase-like lactoylglutathione lyase family enzyme